MCMLCLHMRTMVDLLLVRHSCDTQLIEVAIAAAHESGVQYEGETKKSSNDVVFMSIERARLLVDAIACCSMFNIFLLAICVRNKAVSYTREETKPTCICTHYV